MSKLSDAHTPVLRAWFGMIRRWAHLMKPSGKDDAQLVLDALDADERDDEGSAETRVSAQGLDGEPVRVFRVTTARNMYGNPETRSHLQPWSLWVQDWDWGETVGMEAPPPPSDG